MKGSTNESGDGVFSNYQSDSPSLDETDGGNSSGSIVLKKGPWTSAEDSLLAEYVKKHGEGNWNAVQKHSGLSRCGKSCRLRWANHLRPNLKKGAFTVEEERLIIELHAKMGNKWARMAAHLPGRTDNEIKNYWNTRIKRQQRAGLPLYPPDLCLQEFQDNQQGQNSLGARGCHNPFQHDSCETPKVIFDGLKSNNDVIPYVSALSNISTTSMLIKGFGSSEYYSSMSPTTHQHKRLRESADIFPNSCSTVQNGYPLFDPFLNDSCDEVSWSYGLPIPNDLDHSKSLMSFAVIQGGHSLSNGNSSTSTPVSEAVKLELPSLQYPETDLGSWGTSPPPPLLEAVDTFLQSPHPFGTFESDCPSSRNSELLDALVLEAKNLSGAKNQSSEKSSNSSSIITPGDVADNGTLNVCEAEWEEYRQPFSPLGHSVNSLFNECISASGSSLDEPPPENLMNLEPGEADMNLDQKKGSRKQLDFTCPDTLLALDWFGQSKRSSGCVKYQAVKTDPIATLLGEDLVSNYKQMDSGISSSTQGWGFNSCPWDNMPAVCQISNLP